MKNLLIVLIAVALTSCTMYSIERTSPDGSTTIVKTKSMREFDNPEIHYTRNADGSATFDFGAVKTTNPTFDFLTGVIRGELEVMPNGMIVPVDK